MSTCICLFLDSNIKSEKAHSRDSTARSMLAFYIWGNEATFLGVLGIFTVLGGSLLYTLAKMGENAAAKAAALEPTKEETAEMVPKQQQVM